MTGAGGIDVSYHQGLIDWQQVKTSEIRFVIIRAGYGMYTMDKQFLNNMKGADYGLKIGIYWFLYAKNANEGIRNAEKCAACINPFKDKITLRVFADWEYDSDKRAPGLSVASRTEIVKAFLDRMSSYGYETGIYANPDYINHKFDMTVLSAYPLWLAKYSSNRGAYHPYIWQYSSRGAVAGINGNVDMNIYYGIMPTGPAYPVLRQGSRGAYVSLLQKRLAAKGYSCGSIDGIFGKRTLAAVILFQTDNLLLTDGIVGRYTWGRLVSIL